MRPRATGAMLAIALVAVPAVAAGQVDVSAQGAGALLTHRVDAGLGVEQASGTAFGGQGAVSVGPWLEVSGYGLTGTLTPDSAQAVERTLAEVGALASVTAVPWIAFQLGGTLRSFETTLATQRWVMGRVGAELRARFVNGAFLGTVGGGVMPLVSIDGLGDPDLAVYAAVGVGWGAGPIAVSVAYALERFDFPEVGGVTRREQLAGVRVGVGVRLGR